MVSRILEIHPAATEEADAATDWYAQRRFVAARAFVSELILAVDQVAEDEDITVSGIVAGNFQLPIEAE